MEPCRLTATDLACRRGDRLLFSGLSLDLSAGQACHVTGPNGVGKSSLIRILAGLARPYAGKVERQGSLAMLDQLLALDEHPPLAKALGFWQRIDGDALAPVQTLGLAPLLDVPVRYLSTGQRKRAAIARLIGQQSALWLLDEPLNGLDREAVALVERIVADHCQAGGVALVASHQPFALPAGATTLHLPDFAA
ncbi:MAG: heme ABC exporter ATP-binding protein CcmA [Erythrobacter sp.]|nr:MAG: heme ABC exporter ATP-binding protein CcmA [Erythrobacter sp.]